jgi:hypothetical protein
MIIITKELIENTYDAVTIMRLFSQRLSEGEVDDNEASEMSWMLGSTRKRLEPVLDMLEMIEREQEKRSPAEIEIIDELNKFEMRLDSLRTKLGGVIA